MSASKIPDELLDQLLAGRDLHAALDPGGLIDELKKALAERMLDAENGAQLSIPLDQYGHFDPALLHSHCQQYPGLDAKITALYARGMSTWEIQRRIRRSHGIDISPNLISAITDSVFGEVMMCQVRPLKPSYAIVFFDTLSVKIRDGDTVKDKAVYLAIGMHASGHRQVLGLWIEQSEGVEFWLRVMNEIKDRGTQDILMVVAEDMKGFPEAITAVFPNTMANTSIVNLIRYSMQFAPWERRRSLANALAPIYCANSAAGASVALELFTLENWGRKYPAITQSWRDNWEAVIPFFDFPAEVRRVMHTIDVIETLDASARKAVRNKGCFPNDQTANKLFWLALLNIAKNWKKAPVSWKTAQAKLAVQFESRFVVSE